MSERPNYMKGDYPKVELHTGHLHYLAYCDAMDGYPNWEAFLDAEPTDDELRETYSEVAIVLAADWRVCPAGDCATQYDLPYCQYDLGPIDSGLRELGISFYEAILARDYDTARRLLPVIKAKAEYLDDHVVQWMRGIGR